MTRFIWLAGVAVAGLLAGAPARAAFLVESEFLAAADAGNGVLVGLPAQSIVVTDAFGSYAPEAYLQPVNVGVQDSGGPEFASRFSTVPAPTSEGQLAGNFGCNSFVSPCLGAHTVTYTLPFEISGLGGNLTALFGTGSRAASTDLPFFEIGPRDYAWDAGSGNTPFRYTGFWGRLFDQPTDTFSVVWTPGLRSTDDTANFLLRNAVALVAPGAAKQQEAVPVPEPGMLALFVMALLGLGLARRARG